ncbi:MAG TPA: helix-turn-helix transcriptional regulator [Chloroflexota bacterium]|nr:helix-turn-helix transcriptional regulator [Chloroflexota bacterium]
MGQIIREAFAQWLRGQLRSQGWMVSDFATQVGVRPSAVYRWTAGQRTPTDGQIDKIADALKVKSDVIWAELAREGITPIGGPLAPKSPRSPSAVVAKPAQLPGPERPFAVWIREQLTERGWTAGFLARKIGLDVVTVRAWMGGLRTPASVQFSGISEAFGVDVKTVTEYARK